MNIIVIWNNVICSQGSGSREKNQKFFCNQSINDSPLWWKIQSKMAWKQVCNSTKHELEVLQFIISNKKLSISGEKQCITETLVTTVWPERGQHRSQTSQRCWIGLPLVVINNKSMCKNMCATFHDKKLLVTKLWQNYATLHPFRPKGWVPWGNAPLIFQVSWCHMHIHTKFVLVRKVPSTNCTPLEDHFVFSQSSCLVWEHIFDLP